MRIYHIFNGKKHTTFGVRNIYPMKQNRTSGNLALRQAQTVGKRCNGSTDREEWEKPA